MCRVSEELISSLNRSILIALSFLKVMVFFIGAGFAALAVNI